jgi:hypothetical protein
MAVAIQDAALSALQSWLQTKMGNDVDIDQEWPDPEKPLPAKAITIVAGQWEDDMLQPDWDNAEAVTGHPEQKLYRWRILERTQPFQLDIWATYSPVRSDLVKRLDDALATGTLSNDPVGNGPILSLGNGWTGTVDFLFFGGRYIDNAYAVQQSEYRASYQGEARMILYVKAVSPRQATIKLRETLNGVQRPDVLLSTVS